MMWLILQIHFLLWGWILILAFITWMGKDK